MASRSLNDLHPVTREKAKRFLELAKNRGIDVLVYCTYRSPEEQEILYMQGRLEQFGITLKELNERREKLGLWELKEEEARRKVTNAKPWQSFHQYGLAFDCVPLAGGKPDWSNREAYAILGKIAGEVGLEWAGSWERFRELPHFQDTETYELITKRGR
ncbi:M15 family metallopeptidase [Desulfurobacterium thermolithotrophum]|uniref:M15 family metallopeptidase n=1 Tax=Desulfurobacterium thermolithotrophum TaxID=64160 RepID=UPI0013CFEAC3|nr:M15 family metallopeptidase [Desulfurobacterium thermolithotrophum]